MRHGLQPTKVFVSTANPAGGCSVWLIVSRLSHVGRCGREFYHDQEQSPQSSGNCSNCGHCDDGPCDTGVMPTGEFLWNHANGTMLRDFLVNTYVGGAGGLANPNIDGVFLDDGWGKRPRYLCILPKMSANSLRAGSGPSEVESHSVADMGLSPAQVADIRSNWSETCRAVSAKLAEMKGWSWQMSQNPCKPSALLDRARCTADGYGHSYMNAVRVWI
eukprot:COSAG04_NODE_486_length_13532_cov_5.975359_10_plen_218_part_00